MQYLEDAKKNYSSYSLESRLHFRIHTGDFLSVFSLVTIISDFHLILALTDLRGSPKDAESFE
jgi:hypothetical protein